MTDVTDPQQADERNADDLPDMGKRLTEKQPCPL
jgi:hypothetical protein